MSLSTIRATTTKVATRTVSRCGRNMSTTTPAPVAPRLHKAKENWKGFVNKRPPEDHLDTHKVFHPPYDPKFVGAGILTVWFLGYGSMYFGFAWQQKKQGFWK